MIGLAVAGLIATSWVAPTFAIEANRDWWIFAAGGASVGRGESPYVPGPFIYPPAMAWLWSVPMTSIAWLALKLASLALLVPVLGVVTGLVVIVLSLLQPALQYDLLMGNVTVFYVVAIIWFRRRPGWLGAVPLGVILALAVKPMIIPLLIVEARWRPWDIARIVAVSSVIVALTVPLIGVGPYVDYVRSLLAWAGESTAWVQGNLGPGRYGLVVPALVVGLIVVGIALLQESEERAVVLALGAAVLVQPAYGFYYAALLIPAALELWRIDRLAALSASLLGMLVAFISPALTGLVFVIAGIPWRAWWSARRRLHGRSAV